MVAIKSRSPSEVFVKYASWSVAESRIQLDGLIIVSASMCDFFDSDFDDLCELYCLAPNL